MGKLLTMRRLTQCVALMFVLALPAILIGSFGAFKRSTRPNNAQYCSEYRYPANILKLDRYMNSAQWRVGVIREKNTPVAPRHYAAAHHGLTPWQSYVKARTGYRHVRIVNLQNFNDTGTVVIVFAVPAKEVAADNMTPRSRS